MTNAARAEVEQTLEWARAQAGAVMARAQKGAEQFLAAAGLGEPALSQVVAAMLSANEAEIARGAAPAPSRPAEAFAAPRETPAAASEPPVTEQPVTEPPVSEPPVTEAPPSSPPVSSAPDESGDEPDTAAEPEPEQ